MGKINNELPSTLTDFILLLESIRDKAIITVKKEFSDTSALSALQVDLINSGYESLDHFIKIQIDIKHQITQQYEKENMVLIRPTNQQLKPLSLNIINEKTLELIFKKVLVLFDTESRPLVQDHLDISTKHIVKNELNAFLTYNETEELKQDPLLQDIIKYVNDSLEPKEEIFSHLKISVSQLILFSNELKQKHYIDSSEKFVNSMVKGIPDFKWLNSTVTPLMLIIISICKESNLVSHLNILKAIHKPSAKNKNSGQNLREFKAKLNDTTFSGRKYPVLTTMISKYL